MGFIDFVRTDSSSVWDGNGFSSCCNILIFGVGVNCVTLMIIAILGLTTKMVMRSRTKGLMDKVLLQFVPALGSSISFLDMILIWKKVAYKCSTKHGEWVFSCSQFLVWTSILLLGMRNSWFAMFYGRILSFWWIIKSVFWIPYLHKLFTSLELQVIKCLNLGLFLLVDVIFGISINVMRLKHSSMERRFGEPLLSVDTDLERGCHGDFGTGHSIWEILTFKTISPIMDLGVTKQLDFEDLLQLPVDMDPFLCHDALLNSWQAQQNDHCSNWLLLRSICCAYGWPYFQLGLLKALNDCISFAGPLLLNKLLQFLQTGSEHMDGYFLAVSLGVTSILKSFLDTQYTFHLSRIKLKLRSGVMTLIYRKCLCVSLSERSAFSDGEIQTFMSIDADRTINLFNSFHDLWSLPLQIGVALYLLYTQVKFAFVSGVAITILLIPVNKWISKLIATATQKMMKEKDERFEVSIDHVWVHISFVHRFVMEIKTELQNH